MDGQVHVTGLAGNPVLEPGRPCAAMDEALAAAGAASFVFLPTEKPGRRFTFRKRQTPKMDGWHQAELQTEKGTTPGLVGFDVSRRAARSLGRELGVSEFLWCAVGAPVETHATQWYDQSEWSEWAKVKAKAWTGVPDFWRALSSLRTRGDNLLNESDRALIADSQTTLASLGIVLAAFALAILPAPESVPFSTAFGLLGLVSHPALVVAASLGLLLRAELAPGRIRARDTTRIEGQAIWETAAPRLAALWCLAAVLVFILTWLRGNTGFLFDPTSALLVGLWMVLPIATARNFDQGIEAVFEAGITAAVSIMVIRLSLWVTDLFISLILDAIGAVLPFDLPDALISFVGGVSGFFAELFFLFAMLGYAWFRLQQYYVDRAGEA